MVFEAAGIEIVNIPYQAPNGNAVAERWVRSVRKECLNRLIILNERHLRHVLNEYVAYFNRRRPQDRTVRWAWNPWPLMVQSAVETFWEALSVTTIARPHRTRIFSQIDF
jgi:hypothetical protein